MWETLSFELSSHQEAVLVAVPEASDAAVVDGSVESSCQEFGEWETTAR